MMRNSTNKSGGGGKLTRTQTVTVRLDPKLNYLCELAARAQRRTKSSFIEWAVAESLGSVQLSDVVESNELDATIKQMTSRLWQVDEADRLVALALAAPALLTHEEQLIWRIVRENGYVWKGSYGNNNEWRWHPAEDNLIRERVREYWDIFKAVAAGKESDDLLPKWNKKQAGAFDHDLDDDVPF